MSKEVRNEEQGTRDRILKRITTPLSTNYQILNTRFGFTFIELMVVVAVIGILSALFMGTYPATQRRTRDAERRSDIKQYQTAMEAFANRNNGNYPTVSGVIGPSVLCNTLGVPDCPNDAQNSYSVISNATAYSLWATLEQPPSPVTYFVVCSNGRSFETTTQPDATTPCP